MSSEESSNEDDSAIYIIKAMPWESSQLKKMKKILARSMKKKNRVNSPSSALLRESGKKGPFLCWRSLGIAQTGHVTTIKMMKQSVRLLMLSNYVYLIYK